MVHYAVSISIADISLDCKNSDVCKTCIASNRKLEQFLQD